MTTGRHATGNGRTGPDGVPEKHAVVKTTVQLPLTLRRWFKVYAATQDMTLYDIFNTILREFAEAHGYKEEEN